MTFLRKLALQFMLAVLLWSLMASAPTWLHAQTSAGQNPPEEPVGVARGGYLIHQSIELGYRSTDVSGSGDMYDTLVNLQTGPRILDQTLADRKSTRLNSSHLVIS